MTSKAGSDRPVRKGDLLDCPTCGHRIVVSEVWIASVKRKLQLSKIHSASVDLSEIPLSTNAFPVQALKVLRCSKCSNKGAIRSETSPVEIDQSRESIRSRTEVPVLDPYSVTPDEAKLVIASGFYGKSKVHIIMLHNQMDKLQLTAAERAILENAFSRLSLRIAGDSDALYVGNGGMAVTSKPNRAN